MHLSDERVAEFKELFKKDFGKDLSDAEARESAENLVGFFEILWEISVREAERKRRLRREPDGFPLDGDYSCSVCHRTVGKGENWYSRWGITCLPCLRALKGGVVPGFVCHGYHSSYRTWELKSKFGLHPQTVKKLVREGKIRVRTVLGDDGKPYELVFLKKENPELVDPNRYSPVRKSYDRNRDKVSRACIREEKRKMRAERARLKGKR